MNCAIIQLDDRLPRETILARDHARIKTELREIRSEFLRLSSLLRSSRPINKAKVAARYDAVIARVRVLAPALNRIGLGNSDVVQSAEYVSQLLDKFGWRGKSESRRIRS